MTYEGFHGSSQTVSEITSRGAFGGLFAASSERSALSHGCILHIIVSPNHLTDFELNYGERAGEAEEIAEEIAGELASNILDRGCPTDSTDPEDGIELQRLRGVLASRLGYTSVEMEDEHGTTVLCLPGCTVKLIP